MEFVGFDLILLDFKNQGVFNSDFIGFVWNPTKSGGIQSRFRWIPNKSNEIWVYWKSNGFGWICLSDGFGWIWIDLEGKNINREVFSKSCHLCKDLDGFALNLLLLKNTTHSYPLCSRTQPTLWKCRKLSLHPMIFKVSYQQICPWFAFFYMWFWGFVLFIFK